VIRCCSANQIGVYGGKAGNKGVVGEYEYKGEPYDLARQAEQVCRYHLPRQKRLCSLHGVGCGCKSTAAAQPSMLLIAPCFRTGVCIV
jgi:hypothetical protein